MSKKLTKAQRERLEVLWEELVCRSTKIADLIRVMVNVPSLRRRVWEKLLEQHPTAEELLEAAGLFNGKDRRVAFARALEGELTEQQLRDLIMTPGVAQLSATRKLLERNPESDSLACIIVHVPTLRQEVWALFLQKSPTSDDLRYLMRNRSLAALRVEVAKILIDRADVTDDGLVEIVLDFPTLRKRAWTMLLERNVSASDLVFIAREVSALQKKIWRLLEERGELRLNLCYFVRDVRSFRIVAAQRLLDSADATAEELEAVVCHCDGELRFAAWERLKAMSPSGEMLRRIGRAVPSLLREALLLDKRDVRLIIDDMRATYHE